jgi:WD40 repeat protein
LCYNPNKQILYSASSDGDIFSWNQTDRISLNEIHKNIGVNRELSISYDGQYLANALGKTIQLFDLTKNDSVPEVLNIFQCPVKIIFYF